MKTAPIENNRRILIIDDSQSIQADFQKILAAKDSERHGTDHRPG